MVKRFVSVALSVSLVLSMTPFGMKRALADELPQDNPVEYEVPAEEEEVPEDNFFEAPEEVPEEIPAEEQEVPDEEIPAEEAPEEEQEEKEEEPEEVPAETPSEDEKEVPAEEVPAEKVEEKTEELLDDSEKKEENLEEDAFDEDEVDGAEAVKVLPAVTGLSWAPSRDNGHMKVTWSLDTEDIDEPGDAKVNAVINVYKDGAQIGSVTKGYSTKSVDLTEELWDKFPSQVSGGEAQRAGIARALINRPAMLFADEPTGALNSKTGKDVLDALTKFNVEGQSIVMVTHDIVSARRGNRILYLKDGEIAGELDLGRYISGDKERHNALRDFLGGMGW